MEPQRWQGDGVTQLYVEIEKWDSVNEEAWLWASKSGWTLSSTQDTNLFIYYDSLHTDNATYVGNTSSAPAQVVWDASYLAVYHMSDGADTSHIYDSTSNAHNGAKYAANQPLQADGLSGKAQTFDGTDDEIWCGTGIDFNQNSITYEMSGKTAVSTQGQTPLKVWSDPLITEWIGTLEWPLADGRNAVFGIWDEVDASIYRYLEPYDDSSEVTDNAYHYLAGTLDRTAAAPPDMYKDGLIDNGVPGEGNGDDLVEDVGGEDTFIGSGGGYNYFNGVIDEARISNTARSAAWIKATNYALKDSLITFVEEPSSWANCITINIDHTKVDSTLTQFPVLLHLGASSGITHEDVTAIFSTLGTNSKKIAVTEADEETQLYVEIEKWDSVNEEAWLWVSRSGWTISSSADTTLYLYYDNSKADNTDYVGETASDAGQEVWDDNYLAVYHMNDGANNASVYDSTSNTHHGEKYAANQPLQVAGLSGNAQSFDGTDDDICIGPGIDFNQDNFTYEVSGKTAADTQTQIALKVWSDPASAGWDGVLYWPLDDGRNGIFAIRDENPASVYRFFDPYDDSSEITDNAYHYLAGTVDRTVSAPPDVYQDGILNNGYAADGNCDDLSGDVGGGETYIGSIGGDCYFQGVIDEARFSNAARTAAWIKATNDTLRDNLVTFNSVPPPPAGDTIQDITYTWYEGGNLYQRHDLVTDDVETFTYDFLDRLTGVTGAYAESYSYDEIGNITDMNGTAYSYKTGGSTRPHAVTAIGATAYTYDGNGNMNIGTARTWDVENRLTSITLGGVTTDFVYDGDGNRVKKTVGATTTIYVNKYYEKTGTEVTSNYYLGGKLVAVKVGDDVSYIHQDSLGSTSATSNTSGTQTSHVSYLPFGPINSITNPLPTDMQFTGQRLDNTGLYYYGARYYDPAIGRFISPDTVISTGPLPAGHDIGGLTVSYAQLKWLTALNQKSGINKNGLGYNPYMSYTIINPQENNRYSYTLNNPLKYTDSEGNQVEAIYYIYEAITGALGVLTGQCYGGHPTDTRELDRVINNFLSDFQARCSWWANNIKGWFNGEATTGDPNQDPIKRQGRGQAPKESTPNSEYEQLNEDNKLMSRTTYDKYGRQLMREDFSESGHTHNIKGIDYAHHAHVFVWNEFGFYVEVMLPLP
jgi:RHS repeat-associated protein